MNKTERRYKIWYTLDSIELNVIVKKTESELKKYIYMLEYHKHAKNLDVELLKLEETQLELW